MKNIKSVFCMKKIVKFLAVILWMTLIFYLSAQPVEESNNLSKKVTEVIVDTLEKVKPEIELNPRKMNHILRKNAHFFAYLVLGILVMNLSKTIKIDLFKATIYSLIFCILYAISDEFHQLFVPGRGAQLKDVIIDTSGSITGIIIYLLIFKIRYRMNNYRD